MKNGFKNIVLVYMTLMAGVAYSAGNVVFKEDNSSVKVKINRAGFRVVAEEIKEQILKPIEQGFIKTIRDKISGVDVRMSDISYKTSFDDMSFTPMDQLLEVKLAVSNISIHLDKMKLSTKIFKKISSTCMDIDFKIAHDNPVILGLMVYPVVENNKIDFDFLSVDYSPDSYDYQVAGPLRCTGIWGVRHLIEIIAHRSLKRINKRISEILMEKLTDNKAIINKIINKHLSTTFGYALKDIPGVPDMMLEANGVPEGLRLTDDEMFFTYKLGFDRTPLLKSNDVDLNLEKNKGQRESIHLAQLGLHIDVFNDLLQTVIPAGTNEVELSPEMIPRLAELLNVSALSVLWPDLNEARLDSDKLRLFFYFGEVPKLKIDSSSKSLAVNIPNLHAIFKVKQGGEWVDYFYFNIRLSSGVRVSMKESRLTVSVVKNPSYSFEGAWAESYDPVIEWYEEDVAESLLDTLSEVIYNANPLYSFEVPSLVSRGESFSFTHPHIYGSHLYIDLIKMKKSLPQR